MRATDSESELFDAFIVSCRLDDQLAAAMQINREAAQLALPLVDPYPYEQEPYPDLSALQRPYEVDWTEHGFDEDTLPLFDVWLENLTALLSD